MEDKMAEEFKAKFLDAWPDAVIEGVQQEAQGAVVESERTTDRRLIPLHDVATIVSALNASVSLGRALWSWCKGAPKTEAPEAAADKDKLNQEIRRSGNFGAEGTQAEGKSTDPLKIEVSISKPPQ